jgi:hypothetical protein
VEPSTSSGFRVPKQHSVSIADGVDRVELSVAVWYPTARIQSRYAASTLRFASVQLAAAARQLLAW